jgi:hypothetical protein
MIGDQQLVAGFQGQAAQDGIDTRRRVRDAHDPHRVGTDERGQPLTRFVEQSVVSPIEERDRLAFQLVTQFLLPFQDTARACAEGAVVQVYDTRIEAPVFGERTHAFSLLVPASPDSV